MSEKKVLVGGTALPLPLGKQFLVTQSKGTTIIQPAGTSQSTASQQQYIVTGEL